LKEVSLFFREDPDAVWEELDLKAQEHRFETRLTDDFPQGYISLKIEAVDQSGSSMAYVVEPAFLSYPASGVSTTRVRNIDYTTAISGGIVFINDASQDIIRGMVWCTSPEPTIDANKGITTEGSGNR
jgi:hypothetical protein